MRGVPSDLAILPSCHLTILPSYHLAILPSYHLTILPSCHLTILPSYHLAIWKPPSPSATSTTHLTHILWSSLPPPISPIPTLSYLLHDKLGLGELSRPELGMETTPGLHASVSALVPLYGACMHVCMCACMHVCMCACVHACMHVCMCAGMCACIHVGPRPS